MMLLMHIHTYIYPHTQSTATSRVHGRKKRGGGVGVVGAVDVGSFDALSLVCALFTLALPDSDVT
jgi:hypothetical protein